MDGFIDHIKDKWLEWESIAYAAGALMAIFGILTANDFFQPFSLQIALIFIGILAVYTIFCAIHVRKEKIKASGEANGKNLTCKFKVLFCSVIAISSLIIIVVTGTLLYNPDKSFSDGNYVIWSDKHRVALSSEAYKNYYLKGNDIIKVNGKPTEYTDSCVFELDFDNDGTFTIKSDDKYLGMTHGKNGIHFSDSREGTIWKLESTEDGYYRIINVDEKAYLKWYPKSENKTDNGDEKGNWTTNKKLRDPYKDQYLLCLEKVD